MSVLARKWRSLFRQPWQVKLWLLPVWLLLGAYRAAILRTPFRDLARGFGDAYGVAAVVPVLEPEQIVTARWIGRVVAMAARYTPWESNCFPQALAARRLLRLHRVPYAMYFGLAKSENGRGLAAHAWIAAGPVAVAGGYSFDRYSVVGVYVSAGLVPAHAVARPATSPQVPSQ